MNRNFARVIIGAASVELPVEVISESLLAAFRMHPDDIAVDRFAAVMKDKLAASRLKGRGGWDDKTKCTAAELSEKLLSHAGKGDPVDVANFAMMLHQRAETIVPSTTAAIVSTGEIPFIGGYWAGQGGIYAGMIRGENGAPDRFLIVPTAPQAEIGPVEWGSRGSEIPNCDSNLNGHGNTAAMVEAGNDLALKIAGLRIEGHSDFYLPARHELRLCFLNVPELFQKEWYWSSTQYSVHGAYYQSFETGDQDLGGKLSELRARAVRSIQVSNSVIQ